MPKKRNTSEYIGDTVINFQGYKMTIIDARNTHDIDVQFDDENKTIYTNKKLTDFYRGKIKNINYLLGLTNIAYNGQKMTIIGGDANSLDIKFEDGTIVHNIRKENFDLGKVKNSNIVSSYNIGYIGQGEYNSSINGQRTIEHMKWSSMFGRCYNEKYQEKNTAYKGCEVCEEWHNFQNFAKWFHKNKWGDNINFELDKDILIKGNKIYSPDTCILVDNRINCLFIKNNSKRGNYPIGVSRRNNINRKDYGKFESSYNIITKYGNNKQIWLGYFNTPEEAFQSYKNFKESYIKQVADEYAQKYPNFPTKLYEAMYNYQVEITD